MSPRRGLTLDEILQATEEMANEQGIHAVTLATLAQRLQIRPPSLYNHVDGLKGLHKLMVMKSTQELEATLVDAAIGRAGEQAIRAMGEAYVGFARKRPGLYEAMVYSSLQPDEEVQQLSNRVGGLVMRVMQNGFGMSELETIHATRGLRSILHGFASLERSHGFRMAVSPDESLQVILNTFIAGLGSRSSADEGYEGKR
ncbi:Bacterial regulatory protein, tetR family [compost metagenome]